MAEVSVGRWLGAGFGLIRRHPGAVAAWAVVYIVVGVLPQLAVLALMAPAISELMRSASSGAAPGMDVVLQTQAHVNQLQPLTWITTVVSEALLFGAAYRAVLFPQERSFFFLRAGMREVWLGLVILVLIVGMIVAMVATLIPVGIVFGVLSFALRGGGPFASGLMGVSAVIVVLGVLAWLGLRFSLAPPMSFAERRFRLFESWTATRDHAWSMFIVALVFVLIAIGVELATMLVGFLVAGGRDGLLSLVDVVRQGQFSLAQAAPFLVAYLLMVGVFAAGFFALVGGAWAQMYRDLNPQPEEAFS
jgi:hypothetical protein